MQKTRSFRHHLFLIAGAAIILPSLVIAVPAADAPVEAKIPDAGPLKPIQIDGMHNAFLWTDSILAGSCPEGELGFKSLALRGVKTIITVDGAYPEAEFAQKYGMRYVHIPVAYGGISDDEALRIIRAVRDLPKPVYIHCHHGKHRSPAATALVAMALAGFTNEQALAGLKQSGTGTNYTGLWADVRNFKKPDEATLDKTDNSFPAKAKLSMLSAQMVEMDQRWDHMAAVQAAGWQPPKDHLDIDPAHESLLVKEAFHEAGRSKEANAFPADMLTRMAAAEAAATDLEAALRGKDIEKAEASYKIVKASCGSCHQLYRDPGAPG